MDRLVHKFIKDNQIQNIGGILYSGEQAKELFKRMLKPKGPARTGGLLDMIADKTENKSLDSSRQ